MPRSTAVLPSPPSPLPRPTPQPPPMGDPRAPIPEHLLHPPAPAPAAPGSGHSIHSMHSMPGAWGPVGTPAPLAGGECRQPLLAGLGGRGVVQDALELQLQVPGRQHLPPVVEPDLVEAALVVDGQVLAVHQVQQRVWGHTHTHPGVTATPRPRDPTRDRPGAGNGVPPSPPYPSPCRGCGWC